jgi:alpha-beta hydrolase superfamily lysophospholipase
MTDSWDEPEGINPRGTIIVAAGRGESPSAYARFGRRLGADGYRVRALADVSTDVEAALAAVGKLLVDDSLPGPKVVVGSDTGALFALLLAAREAPGLDALILAGLPAPAAQTTGDNAAAGAGGTASGSTAGPGAAGGGVGVGVNLVGWEAELEARTACPAHRGVLSNGGVTPGALLSARIPTEIIGDTGFRPAVPVLGLHGDDDPVSPLAGVRGRYPAGTLVSIAGGRHDVLNDVTHRTVAATIVLFLERLRLGADLPLIARVES